MFKSYRIFGDKDQACTEQVSNAPFNKVSNSL